VNQVVGQRGNDGVREHDRPASSGALRRADRECAIDLNKLLGHRHGAALQVDALAA
jgi:hypothetical protein